MKLIVLLLVLSCAISCGQSNATDSSKPQTRGADSGKSNTPSPANQKLAVGPVEAFASWNNSYIKLEQWKDTGDPNVPHPQSFDIVCPIANEGDSSIQEGDLIILTTMDFVIAPTYLHNGDVNKIISEVAWGRVTSMDDVKMERVPYLKPRDRAQVKIKGFDLSRVIKEYQGKEDTLWPWAVRANVRVLSRDMTPVAQGQVILPIIPSDARLSGK